MTRDAGFWASVAGLTQAEVDYLVQEEWATCAADVVWRRSKLGLRLGAREIEALDAAMLGSRAAA